MPSLKSGIFGTLGRGYSVDENKGPHEVWTPLRIIQWAVPYLKEKGLPQPRLDVEILLAHALGVDRLKVYLQFDRPLNKEELGAIRELLKRRAKQEPLQYILGWREFFGFRFKVTPDVLIPRPETEGLVERALILLKGIPLGERGVLDLGTGSGCIAISLAKSISCRVWGIDISAPALEIARENARILDAQDSLQWRQGDWFEALQPGDPKQFQIILSNPPYISLSEKGDLAPEVRDFEPSLALFGGERGSETYRVLAQKAQQFLVPGGVLLLELHPDRSEEVEDIFKGPGWGELETLPDLQGLPRVLSVKKATID